MDRIIIGLTGAFGSGATFLAEKIFAEFGFERHSLSDILRDKYVEKHGKQHESRHDLQEFGNLIRSEGDTILARLLDEKVISRNQQQNYIVDSIRNPAEIRYFRGKYPEFVLVGVFADYDIRWDRVKDSYDGSKDSFDIDEQRDKGSFEPQYGQKISDCFFESDLVLSNNEEISYDGKNEAYNHMYNMVEGYLKALRNPTESNPTLKETLMAAAYTSGRRSKCLKRKVGAVIADKYDRIISSGFNGVPMGLRECTASYGGCYRDKKRDEIGRKISNELELDSNVIPTIKKNVKLLELCRALHGEESAILNLVGRGVDLKESTIYVTTHPCNLCANKIVQAGIAKVVYFEPYPVKEAKAILKEGKVHSEPFEGVTFRAFFKFYQYTA